MNYYPIFLDLHKQNCLVVGGGSVAFRKIKMLRRSGARVTVMAPCLSDELAQCVHRDPELLHVEQCFNGQDLSTYRLVIAATDQVAVNQQVAKTARQQNILVNVVDQPELCTFISPAIVDRNPLIIAISSAGAAPVLARQIRQRLEQWLPDRMSSLAQWAGNIRQKVKQALPFSRRRPFWEQVFFGAIARHWLAGREAQATQAMEHLLEQSQSEQQSPGEVYIVGAGPGHPDLLTLRALQLMQQADVVLHDRLVSDAILERVRRDAERIFVGKQSGCHHKTQDQINALMVDLARQGLRVCRLKGGDPLIFGRGGEEAEYLVEHDIPYQIVPGITSAAGCAAYAGIPLTHRKTAHGVQLITGHVNGSRTDKEWEAMVNSRQTLVFYMAVERLQDIVTGLLQGGAEDSLPVAIIERGTLPQQRTVIGTLKTIEELANQAQIESPSLLIVGETCALAEQLDWYQPQREYSVDIGTALAVA